ncbi:M-phase inducer phosphatase-like isoform X2 [Ischnura elegans]|uniref:M-phase inducer phosphatase-like isoform X2 n=1 Tax=Ischnura elegans TaxID=197161 RepID=UPI001ED88B57|nr:M-phase inducer phosphatase-like isoform X2 [Ischnura elegans]
MDGARRRIGRRIQKNSPKSTIGKSAAGPLATRNRVIPWRLGPCHGSYDKENISAAAEGTASASHEGQAILSLNSPPPKRLGNVLPSPLKARHPLEDHDPNSQDSGFGNCIPDGEEFRGIESSPSLKAKLAAGGFHIEVSKSVKLEEHSRHVHHNEKVEISRQISITSTSSVDESLLASPSKPLALSQQSNSSTPGKKSSPHRSPKSIWSISKYRSPLRHSHSSGAESIDDGFLEIFELESAKSSEAPSLPAGIGSLLSKPIVRSSEVSGPRVQVQHPTFRRCVSLVETSQTPPSSRARLCLFRDPKPAKLEEKENADEASPGTFGFKRPEPPEGFAAQVRSKKRRCMTISQPPDCDSPSIWSSEAAVSPVEKVSPPVFQRSVSDSEAVIKRALLRSSLEPDLIGDFTRPYSLPLIPGRHQDLKTISSDTLARLLQGEYEDCIDSYSIIDCRYPYEYEGGHIKGAKNLFTHEQILKEFMSNPELLAAQNSSKPEGECCEGDADKSESRPRRDILVFHCEFSSERGPRLSRFLRNSDRDRNKECYPALHYPEIYLLHGGYKEFFDKHSHLCEPCSYLPMADPRYESDLRSCRAKSKSWTGGMGTSGMEGSRLPMRGSLKRLGL